MSNVPDGYPTPEDDQTGLRMDVGYEQNVVHVRFSKPVMQMSLQPHQVRSLAIALLQNAEMAAAAFNQSPAMPPSRMNNEDRG